MKNQRLLNVDRDAPVMRSRCTDLEPIERDQCLTCRGPVTEHTVAQPALFRFGGYGATKQLTVQVCRDTACASVRLVRIDEVRPERQS